MLQKISVHYLAPSLDFAIACSKVVMLRSKRTVGGQRKSRAKRRRRPVAASVPQDKSTDEQSTQGSTTDSQHTPREGFVVVDVEKVRTRFSHLQIAGSEPEQEPDANERPTCSDSPRTREKGTLRKRTLFPIRRSAFPLPPWSYSELLALVTFLLLHTDGRTWPSRRCDDDFWENAAKFVQTLSKVHHCRTGE